MKEPDLFALRITDDREGGDDAPIVRSRALQLQEGETRVSLDAIARTFHFHFMRHIIFCAMQLYL